MTTKSQFDDAAKRLLGEEKYTNLLRSGYSRPDFCREIALDEFIGGIFNEEARDDDLNLVREVAGRLWRGDGTTGLVD